MATWWFTLSLFEQFLWIITLPATAVFVVQTILSFLGIEGHSGHDLQLHLHTDMTHSDMGDAGIGNKVTKKSTPVVTLKNTIVFLMMFGWTALTAYQNGLSVFSSLLLATIVGIAMMYLLASMLQLLLRQTEDGTMDLNNALYATGEVYLTIPANQSGKGKIIVKFQGAEREIEAMTLGDKLPTGKAIRVVSVLDDTIVLVDELF